MEQKLTACKTKLLWIILLGAHQRQLEENLNVGCEVKEEGSWASRGIPKDHDTREENYKEAGEAGGQRNRGPSRHCVAPMG